MIFFAREIILQTSEEDLLKQIKHIKDKQEKILIIALAKKEAKWVKHGDGLITWQDRIYIPRDSKLREDIIYIMTQDLPATQDVLGHKS